jgi:hypothetical protein
MYVSAKSAIFFASVTPPHQVTSYMITSQAFCSSNGRYSYRVAKVSLMQVGTLVSRASWAYASTVLESMACSKYMMLYGSSALAMGSALVRLKRPHAAIDPKAARFKNILIAI